MGLLLLTAALGAVGQIPKDVTGWNGIAWGDSNKKVVAALGSLAAEPGPLADDSEWVAEAGITGLVIADMPVKGVVMSRPEGGGAQKIMLTLGDNQETLTARNEQFLRLKQLLMTKYGKPSSEDKRASAAVRTETVIWAFPSTKIELELRDIPVMNIRALTVSYEKTRKAAADKL